MKKFWSPERKQNYQRNDLKPIAVIENIERFQVVYQPDKFACGPSCVYAVLNYTGTPSSFEEVDQYMRNGIEYTTVSKIQSTLDQLLLKSHTKLKALLEKSTRGEGIEKIIQIIQETGLPIIAGHSVNISLPFYLTKLPKTIREKLIIDSNSEYAHAGVICGVYYDKNDKKIVEVMDPWAGLPIISPKSRGFTYYDSEEFVKRMQLDHLGEETRNELKCNVQPGDIITLRKLN